MCPGFLGESAQFPGAVPCAVHTDGFQHSQPPAGSVSDGLWFWFTQTLLPGKSKL